MSYMFLEPRKPERKKPTVVLHRNWKIFKFMIHRNGTCAIYLINLYIYGIYSPPFPSAQDR